MVLLKTNLNFDLSSQEEEKEESKNTYFNAQKEEASQKRNFMTTEG